MTQSTSEIKQKTISGFFWRFGERICAQVVTFIVNVVLARILMPDHYGIIAIVNVFIAIADSLITGGLGSALIQKKDSDEMDFSTIFCAGLVLAFVLYGILFFSCPLISKLYKNDLLTSVLRVMGIRLFISSINSVQQAYVARKMIFKKFFFATIIGTIISAIVGIVMALKGFGVWALVAQQLVNPIIDTIVLFITVEWRPKFEFSFERFKSLFSFGWKIMGANLSGTFFSRLKNLIIGAKYTSSDLAFYNRGESLPVLVTSNITATLESVLFPAISKFQDEKEKLKASVRRSMAVGSYVLLPLLFGLAATADKIVLILFSEKWKEAIPFVQIICFQEMTELLTSINLQAIKAVGRSDIVLKLKFIKKPVYLLIIIACVQISPLFMSVGAAIYGIIAFFINSFPNKKILSYSFFEQLNDIKESFFLSLIMGVGVYFFGKIKINIYISLFLQICLGVGIYIFLSWIFKNESFGYLLKFVKDRKRNSNNN